MRLYLYIILTSIMFFGCKKSSENTVGDIAYLGGEIINPNNNLIILSKDESLIDTIKLDGRNRFMHKIENLETGIYTFKHGKEFQMVLLEPNDSVLIRLNTMDFDESLVFTGIGSKQNNYLINDFLENEKIEKKIYKYCQLSPKGYLKKIDSLKDLKTDKLTAFDKKYSTSNLFRKTIETNIKHNYYFFKEVYPVWHRTSNKHAIFDSLPDNFYDYREEVDYSNELLKENFTYNNFLKTSINNLALQKHFKKNRNNTFKRMSLSYNLDKLKLIDSLVKNSYIKNDLLHHVAFNFLSRSKDFEKNNIILNSYLDKTNSEKGKKMITNFSNALHNLKNGSSIPNIKIINYNNSELDIASLADSPAVISFWSHTFYDHFKKSHYKINNLKDKYPEIKFITINIDDYGLEKSKQSLKNNRFSCNDEYYFKNPKESIEIFAIHPMSKTILIDENKKIVNGNTNMFSRKFEEQLLGLINR